MRQVFPECYADTTLIQFLINDPENVVHIYGIPNVAKELKEAEESEKLGVFIGIVDKDKRTPPHLLTFETILEQNKVCLKQRGTSAHYLIVIDKAIESFLLWNANQTNLDLIAYGFPTEVKLLGRRLKTTAIGTDPDYLRLLGALLARQAPGFVTLHHLLNEFIVR